MTAAARPQPRLDEVNMATKMALGRNQLFLEPFDVFDPHHPLRGKRRFDVNFRPLRSKINLKIQAPEAARKKRVNKVTISQKAMDDFEKKYAFNCDQTKMRVKNRNVSNDSPFDPRNKPPDQYVKPERILEKPCKLDLRGIDSSKIPLAGKLGSLGHKILSDFKNANQLTDYDWAKECFMTEQLPRARLGKRAPQPVAKKLTHISHDQGKVHEANFSLLHRNQLYPSSTHHFTQTQTML